MSGADLSSYMLAITADIFCSARWGDHSNLGSVDLDSKAPTPPTPTSASASASYVNANAALEESVVGKVRPLTSLANGCALEWLPVLVELSSPPTSAPRSPSLSSSSSSSSSYASSPVVSILPQVCLGGFSSSGSVFCGGGHVLIKLSARM